MKFLDLPLLCSYLEAWCQGIGETRSVFVVVVFVVAVVVVVLRESLRHLARSNCFLTAPNLALSCCEGGQKKGRETFRK